MVMVVMPFETLVLFDCFRMAESLSNHCDLCQRAKHPTQSYTIEEKHQLPTKPGDLCAIALYGVLPTSRSGVKYILVCYDVFSKHVKLFHFFALFFIRAISKLYICIPTNCTQLIYFINNTLKHMYCLKF